MTGRRSVLIVLSVVIAFVFSAAGCTTVSNLKKTGKKIVQDIRFKDPSLVKKIGIVRIVNRSAYQGQGIEKRLQDELVQKLKSQYAYAMYVTSEHPGSGVLLEGLPVNNTGGTDNLKLVTAGRASGFNAIVNAAITDISQNNETHGWFWFKSDRRLIRMTVSLEVYSMLTGAKLLDESLVCETELEEAVALEEGALIRNLPELTATVSQMAFDSAERICDIISSDPWTGYVISVAGDKLVISSGKQTGLLPGDLLEVYDGSQVAEGVGAQRFFMPGKKLGQLRITRVFEDRAEAELASGDNVREGCTVSGNNG
ncbi:MAG: hypothetical protein PHP23_12465 [Desulfobacterales bacterium]|nr:hypothetical protein [Desulfobacterales bacterium]MDD4073162.1 hypothetical protein [Desulfobacterales bacterium]MDD4392525.1 hypothetical protein [Desulfobacterales bacterium]